MAEGIQEAEEEELSEPLFWSEVKFKMRRDEPLLAYALWVPTCLGICHGAEGTSVDLVAHKDNEFQANRLMEREAKINWLLGLELGRGVKVRMNISYDPFFKRTRTSFERQRDDLERRRDDLDLEFDQPPFDI